MRLTMVFLGAALATGCMSESDSGEFGDDKSDGGNDGFVRMDVNDVSILYPLPSSEAGLADLIALDAETARGPLLSREQFAELVALIHPEDDPNVVGLAYESWRIVGVRVDPCEMVAPGMPCTAQLRLVAQSFSGTTTDDNAIHLVYAIPEGDVAPMLRDLVALKTSNPSTTTNKKALGIHPILKKQGLTGAFAAGLRTLVTTYAGKAASQNVTVMFTLDAGDWRFGAGTVATDGHVTQVPVPCSPTPTISMRGTTGSIGNFIASVDPGGTCADNVNEIIDSNGKNDAPFLQGSFFKLSAEQQDADVDLALRVINPGLNRVATTDCVACHTASRALARVKDTAFLNLNDDNPNRFVPPRFTTTKYATSPIDAIGPYNVRAFGYQGRDVAYAQVTVNLSALAADAINQKIRLEHLLDAP
jgi:hypothetical protein